MQPPPAAPELIELLELSLAGAVSPAVYRGLAARPAPTFKTAAALAMASGAASTAVDLAHNIVANPGFLDKFPLPLMAIAGVSTLGMYGGVTLLLAAVMYGLGNALGGKGAFDRGLQCAAMLSVLWPLQMMCNWFAFAWILPSALAAWVATLALEGLFGAKPWPSRALCTALGCGALALQAVAHVAAVRADEEIGGARATAQDAAAPDDFVKQLQTASESAAPPPDGAASRRRLSGLDLLRAPQDGSDAMGRAAPAPTPAEVVEAARGMQADASGMLDAISPLLDNPMIAKNMPPGQKANMAELRALMADLKTQLASGNRVGDAAFARKMRRFQNLTLKIMTEAATTTPLKRPEQSAP